MIISKHIIRALLIAAAAFVLMGTGLNAQTGTPHECNFCHVLHGAPGPSLLNDTDVEVVCLTCHGPAGTSTLKAAVHTNDAGTFTMTCIDCHTPHSSKPNWMGGTNIKQVGRLLDGSGFAKIQTPNSGLRDVVFESRGTDDAGEPSLHSFADNDEDNNSVYDGVCETCHTGTSNHTNSAPDAAHYTGETCTRCHAHDDNFKGSGACTDCHNADAGTGTYAAGTRRRQIIGASGDFLNSIGGHMSGADPTNYECVVCHREGYIDGTGEVALDAAYHNAGTAPYAVDLRNVDDANASFPVKTDPGSWNATYANNLTEFCLHCHDGDGASVVFTERVGGGGSASNPFGDGNSPLNLYEKFLISNFSSHAINSARTDQGTLGAMYAANYPTDPLALTPASFVSPWDSTSTVECSDCHLGEDPGGTPTYYHNAHGGRNLQWLLADKNGLDQTISHGGSTEQTTSTIICFKCHSPDTYGQNGTSQGNSRFPEHDHAQHSTPADNVFGIGCLNCHGGDTFEPYPTGPLVKGGIHGTNRSDDADDGNNGAYDRLRFTNGAALDYFLHEAGGDISCSSQKSSGAIGHNSGCTQHGSKTVPWNF